MAPNVVHDRGRRASRGKDGGNETRSDKTHSLINKGPSNESHPGYTTGKKKCPKALLTPNTTRTDGSPGSLGKVHAEWRPQTETLAFWQRAQGINDIQGRRREIQAQVYFSHQVRKIHGSGYLYLVPTGRRACVCSRNALGDTLGELLLPTAPLRIHSTLEIWAIG